MRKCIIALFGVLTVYSSYAQVNNKMNYQAIARDVAGNILSNHYITLRMSILSGPAGPAIYAERDSVSTNQFGLFTLQIGGGLPLSGNYNTINWSAGNHWLRTEMDVNGGFSYVLMGTSELLSVPYALYAASGNPGATGPTGATGVNGATGVSGSTGPTGIAGSNGTT